jgi:hypothetical protein
MRRLAVGLVISLSLLVGGCEALTSMGAKAVIGQVAESKPLLDAQIGGSREGFKLQDNTMLDGDLEELNTESMIVNVDNGTPSWLIALMIVLIALPDGGTMWDTFKSRLFRKKEANNAPSE